MVFFLALYSVIVNLFILSNRHLWQYSYFVVRMTTVVEFLLFSIFFFRTIESKLFIRGMMVVSGLIALLFIYSFFFLTNNSFDSVPSGITSLVFFIYCIFYLFEKIKDDTSLLLYSTPAFWIVVSIIVYSAGTFFPFIYAQGYSNKPEFESEYTLIHSTLYILRNLLFCVAMLIKGRTAHSPYSLTKKKNIISPPN